MFHLVRRQNLSIVLAGGSRLREGWFAAEDEKPVLVHLVKDLEPWDAKGPVLTELVSVSYLIFLAGSDNQSRPSATPEGQFANPATEHGVFRRSL